MPRLTVYTVPNCLDCGAVKNLLTQAGIPFKEVDISDVPKSREALELLSGIKSVPQVFLDGTFIGQLAEIRYLIQNDDLLSRLHKE